MLIEYLIPMPVKMADKMRESLISKFEAVKAANLIIVHYLSKDYGDVWVGLPTKLVYSNCFNQTAI